MTDRPTKRRGTPPDDGGGFNLARTLVAVALFILGFPLAAESQTVLQTGTVTPGHVVSWTTSGVVQDAGTATLGKINSFGLYGLGGTPFAITNSATPAPFSGSYSQMGLGLSTSAAYLSVQGYGGATALPFQININGATVFQTSATGTLLPLPVNQIYVGNASGLSAAVPMSGDCAILSSGHIGCLSLNGTSPGTLFPLGYDGNFTASGGNLALATVPSGSLLGNATGSTTEPTSTPLSSLLDSVAGSSQGSVLYRGAAGWASIAPGSNGTYLQSQGAAANPTWSIPGTISSLGTIFTSTSGNPTFIPSQFMIVVNNASPAATTVTLEASPAAGRIVVVADGGNNGSGTAQTYPITVSGNGHTINGQSSVVIRSNGASLSFAWTGTFWVQW